MARNRTLSEQNIFSTLSLSEHGGIKGLFKSWSKPSTNTQMSLVSTQNEKVSKQMEKSPHLMIGVVNNDHQYLSEQIAKGEVTTEQVLFACVEEDNDLLFKLFLDDVQDINKVYEDEKEITLLHIAAEKGSLKCIKILLEIDALPNIWDASKQFSPMHKCAVNVETGVDIMKLLVLKGADINLGYDKEEGSVIHHAVRAKNVEIVKYLIKKKVKTRPQDTSSSSCRSWEFRYVSFSSLSQIRSPAVKSVDQFQLSL